MLAGLGDGSGGVFVAGTVEIGDDPWFFDDPGQAFLAFNLASSYDTGPANTLNKLGSLTLDVSGINPGLNSISYDGEVLDAIDADTGFQIGASSTPSNYTVTAAVPEPSCIFLGIAVFGICLFRRRHHIS